MAKFLVTQATGQQSQAVIRHLLATGARIHAVVRDPSNVPAVLKDPGVTIFKGESVNFNEIRKAADGCRGAFLNTYAKPGVELPQAKTIVEACQKSGIQSVVASTAFCTGNQELWNDEVTKEIGLWNYYQSKFEVEEIVRKGNFSHYTILRPGFIHLDYLQPAVQGNYSELLVTAELVHAFDHGVAVPHTDADDIGRYTAAALLDPERFSGAEIDFCAQSLSVHEVRDILVRVSGREVRVRKRSAEEIDAAKGVLFVQAWHLWANAKDFGFILAAGAKAQKVFGIPFTNLEEALQRDRDRLRATIPA